MAAERATPALDGTLQSWAEVRERFDAGSALLCGNGLSINVWSRFAYSSLFDHATGDGLSADDLELFAETENFERVLSDLGTAIRVNQVLRVEAAPVLERYQSVQRALGHAIREVHVRRGDVPDRPIAVSMVRTGAEQLAVRQREMYARLKTDGLCFFDACTHPLGDPALRVG